MTRDIIEHRTKDKEATRELIKVIEKIHSEARKFPGYISGDTFIDVLNPCHVVVLSSWQTLEDSKAWYESQVSKSFAPLIEKHLAEQRTTLETKENVIWKFD
jgi:heme-degrading monooxygenase HmoA